MHLIEHALLFRKKDFVQSAEKQFNVEVMKSLDKSLGTYQGELFARLLDTVKAIKPEALRYVWIQSECSSLKFWIHEERFDSFQIHELVADPLESKPNA